MITNTYSRKVSSLSLFITLLYTLLNATGAYFLSIFFSFPIFFVSGLFLGNSVNDLLPTTILMSFAGPTIIFIIWFSILYLVTYIFSKFSRKASLPMAPAKSNRPFFVMCIVGVLMLNIGHFMVNAFYTNSERGQGGSLNLAQTIDIMSNPIPKITSINTTRARIGDVIQLGVSGLGHEQNSYIEIWKSLPETSGMGYYRETPIGIVWSGRIPSDNLITFTIKRKICRDQTTDDICKIFADVTSGNYSMRLKNPETRATLALPFTQIID